MTKQTEALKLALDYIVATNKSSEFWLVPASNLNNVVTAIKDSLAQPEQEPDCQETGVCVRSRLYAARQPKQEPVEVCCGDYHKCSKPCTLRGRYYGEKLAPQRPWVGLTAQEAADCWTTSATQTWKNFEAALKKKNT